VVCADSLQVSRARSYLGYSAAGRIISSTGPSPSTADLPRSFDYDTTFSLLVGPAEPTAKSHNPAHATPAGFNTCTVWPDPLSLATTHGISFPAGTEMFHFPAFPPEPYIFRNGSHDMTRTGFPHSDILGSRFACQLPEAYRRLLRPSSAPGAKASTLCPYKLQTTKTKYKDARVHCAVLKQQPDPTSNPHQHPHPPQQ
jgi:hypothetical protein